MDNLNAPASLLTLPTEIVLDILGYLPFHDLVAVCLTAKGLWEKYRPKLPEPTDDPSRKKANCATHLHNRYLPRPEIPAKPHNCPYCQQELCPPTCHTALILDSDSGHFFPRNLFPVHLAKFKYAGMIDTSNPDFLSTPDKVCRSTTEYPYSTIWCEHHRCPRDLLAKKEYRDIENGLGARLFLKEYEFWRNFKILYLESGLGYWTHDRWKVGYRLPPTAKSTELGTPGTTDFASNLPSGNGDNDRDDPTPIHEKFFYDSMCLHCLSALPSSYSVDPRHGRFVAFDCKCSNIIKQNKTVFHYGCPNCGCASVKFTRVEAFNFVEKAPSDLESTFYREGFWMYIATKSRIVRRLGVHQAYGENAILGNSVASMTEKYRLHPVDPQLNAELLEIVRGQGYNLTPLPQPLQRTRIQDLPYNVLADIFLTLNMREKKFPKDDAFMATQASYQFGKSMLSSAGFKFIMVEPYWVMMNLYNRTAETRETFARTKEYMDGQRSHKNRRLGFDKMSLFLQETRRLVIERISISPVQDQF
ncbi:hypothetical protein TWF694_000460 [Orbilia ellipsospora]|uniref:F-box domain-containing protein n=1 Tax=Orbilia ellipsospora TaxID=2528407 RepID=A0AAV9XQE4_9PEZI